MSFVAALRRHQELFSQLESFGPQLVLLADQVFQCCVENNGKVFFLGNGGSAADCQHLAAEFVVRYKQDRRPLAALALTTDTSILTAHSNDYSYSSVFDRQLQALCQPQDLVIGMSTSGNSANVVSALRLAQSLGATGWAMTGDSGGQLRDVAQHCIRVPCAETARIQEAHLFFGHWLCEALDSRLEAVV